MAPKLLSEQGFYEFIDDYGAMTGKAITQVQKGMEDGEPYRAWVFQGEAPDPVEIGRFTPTTGTYLAHMKFVIDIEQADRCVRCKSFLKPYEGYEFESAFGERVAKSVKPFAGLHCNDCMASIHRKHMVDKPRPIVRVDFSIECQVK